jgi:glycosyltransferase involved in cell wall biosynthesis
VAILPPVLVTTESSRNTVLTGFANQSAIGQMDAAADVHVLSSAVEPYGLVVSEASAFGLPGIVSAGRQDVAAFAHAVARAVTLLHKQGPEDGPE